MMQILRGVSLWNIEIFYKVEMYRLFKGKLPIITKNFSHPPVVIVPYLIF